MMLDYLMMNDEKKKGARTTPKSISSSYIISTTNDKDHTALEYVICSSCYTLCIYRLAGINAASDLLESFITSVFLLLYCFCCIFDYSLATVVCFFKKRIMK